MLTKSLLISLAIPTIVISNSSSSYIYNEAKTEVSGENASARTEIITNVNGQETKIESNQPGEVKVEVKNGQATVITSPSITPIITLGVTATEPIPTLPEKMEEIREDIFSLIKNLFSKIFSLFHFRA